MEKRNTYDLHMYYQKKTKRIRIFIKIIFEKYNLMSVVRLQVRNGAMYCKVERTSTSYVYLTTIDDGLNYGIPPDNLIR